MAQQEKLRICLTSAEFGTLAKTGGLADVASALSGFLHERGHDVRVLLPRYARLEKLGLAIEPVEALQDLTMKIGPWRVSYAIDRARLPESERHIYLLRCPALYDREGIYTNDDDEHLRFILLSRAAIEMCQHMQFAPHIFHSHDWHTALIPLYLKSVYAWDQLFQETKSVFTIHNIGYQGMFPSKILPDLNLGDFQRLLHQDDLADGYVNFMKTAILYADLITTVSPTYAREIQTPEYGVGLDPLLRERSRTVIGILNGVDYADWNPETDTLIPRTYSSSDLRGKRHCKKVLMSDLGLTGGNEQPLIGVVTRLVGQKGIDLMQQVMPRMLSERDFSLAVLGSGEPRYEQFFSELQAANRERVCFYRGFSNKLAHWIEAGADMFLMPSLYEPCGLNQMYSLRYGTVPIVRGTGGLADSVELVNVAAGSGTGIVFRDYDATGLRWAVNTALDLYADPKIWKRIMQNGMAMNYSWDTQGERFVELFRKLSNL